MLFAFPAFSQKDKKALLAAPPPMPAYDESLYNALQWRCVGPFRGGRSAAVTGVAGQPNLFYFGSTGGGVWRTTDGGASWELGTGMRAPFMPPERAEDPAIQDVHYLARCAGAPDVLWAQHHSGIYRSTDDARTWTEITEAGPSTFGFPVAAHPTDPDTAWFVPAQADEWRLPVDGKVVVTRTRDGGASFDVLSEGLPPAPAWDLVHRHGLAIDQTGERLAFGSTTGSLWVSEDAGDTWTHVSAHLPPVHVVRFA